MQIESEIRSVWRELKVHKKQLWVIAISGLLMAGADIGDINLLKGIFDGIQKGNIDVIKASFQFFIALAFVKNVARYIHIFNMNMVSERVTQGYREKLQQKFMKLNLTFHNTYASGSGGLISRVMNDVQVIYHGLRMFADLFREPVAAVGFLATLFYLNWKLTLYVLFVLPLILFFLRSISKNIKKFGLKGQEDLEKITGTLKESLDGVRVIQSFNLESEMGRRFHEQSGDFLNSRKQVHRLVESSGPITEFTMIVVSFLVILYMSYGIVDKTVTLGDLIAYFGAILSMQNPIKKFQESYVRIQETVVSIRRAHELLNLPDEVPQSPKQLSFPENWQSLEYRNVSFRYGSEYVLKNFSLNIKRGEQIAFVGASGSGKSTLVNLLERFFDPTEGQILVDDTPITDIHLTDLRSHIALVTQDVFLFSDTIEKNIWAGDFTKDPHASGASVQNAAQAANADAFIQRTPGAYQNRVGDRGNLLSGGEKQRVSIARAVFKDAPILILDEATSALDSKSEAEVQKGLDAAMKGRTALIIAHRLSTVQKAHRICVMKAGELIEMGSHQELLAKNGEYATMYKLQS